MVMVFIGKAGEQVIAALRKSRSKDSGFFMLEASYGPDPDNGVRSFLFYYIYKSYKIYMIYIFFDETEICDIGLFEEKSKNFLVSCLVCTEKSCNFAARFGSRQRD